MSEVWVVEWFQDHTHNGVHGVYASEEAALEFLRSKGEVKDTTFGDNGEYKEWTAIEPRYDYIYSASPRPLKTTGDS